jgi:hypothetical protein
VPEAVTWAHDKEISEILDLLVALEANTFDLYLKLGRQVAPGRSRSGFMELSEEESRHLAKIASVFEKTIYLGRCWSILPHWYGLRRASMAAVHQLWGDG